jgi:hypothetical protein
MAIFPRAKADVSEAVSPRECRGLSLETGPICLCGLLEAQVSSQRLAAILNDISLSFSLRLLKRRRHTVGPREPVSVLQAYANA